jgi:hypothetical protein
MRFVIAALLFVAATPALAAKPHYQISGKVVKIVDGDTLTILDASNEQHKIRLAGIDAPEKGQPFGTKARTVLLLAAPSLMLARSPYSFPRDYHDENNALACRDPSRTRFKRRRMRCFSENR